MKLYYFSGTGNSKNVVTWIANAFKSSQVINEVYSINEFKSKPIHEPVQGETLVFCSPVHGFNYPPVMIKFMWRFPKTTFRNQVVLMNTRAGMLIGKWVTPGVSGISIYMASLILWLKGYKIQSMYAADLPSNWISVHPGLNDRTVNFINQSVKQKVEKWALEISEGKRNYKVVRELIQDAVASLIAPLYYFAGRFIIAKTYYASKDCTKCGLCVKQCPVSAIKWVDDRPFWTIHCESCMHCMSYCPEKAIETAHGFIFGAFYLVSALLTSYLYWSLDLINIQFNNSLLQFVLETIVFLSILVVLYRAMHFAMRFKFFERIIVYTSLTQYKFWGRRYKAPKSV